MLAALIANNQNVPQPTKLPTVKIDRGGGGQSWPSYEIVDIVAAAATFLEISGEEPAARAARRHRWIGQVLPVVKEAREKREAAAFLTGAQFGAAAEREAAMEASRTEASVVADKLSIDRMNQIVEKMRGVDASPTVQPRDRGASSSGGALAIGIVVGVMLGVAIVGKRRRRH